jgi:lipid II:glycine glycyltransferase (peptidoglycan interpeptide bridge formation enzyme)
MTIAVEPCALEELDGGRELLQSGFWGAFRRQLGWRARGFRCTCRGRGFPLLVLLRRLAPGLELAYVPHGPETEEPAGGGEGLLHDLAGALRPYLGRCVFLRYDIPWGFEGWGNLPPPLPSSGGLYKAPMDVQPPSTVILDLTSGEEQLLASMKSKTRYNIRLSARKGVETAIVPAVQPRPYGPAIRPARLDSDLSAWYRLYEETARRDRITLHGEGYYRRLFELAGSYGPGAPELYLLNAWHEGELLAGIIVALKGEEAWYLYGASSERKRNLMPAYALQWRAIRLARERGCRRYDLFGIPPTDDPGHPMHGLLRFKIGFGGRVLNRPGCYDVPLRPLLYSLYRGAETLRRSYYRSWRKRPARS